MIRTIGRIALLVLCFLFLICCDKAALRGEEYGKVEANVRFQVGGRHTKSSLTADEDIVNNIHIVSYSDGKLLDDRYFSDIGNSRITLLSGKSCRLYVFANMGRLDIPLEESELAAYRYRIDNVNEFGGCFPMFASSETDIAADDGDPTVSITLKRLVAKYDFRIDKSALPGMQVTSIRLMQSALDVAPLTDSVAENVGDGDFASEADLEEINHGESATFYTLENCRGVLLPENKDPWAKIPDNIPDQAELCTYIEVKASFNEGFGLSGDVTYRFYLGEDNVSDFNVHRNTMSVLTLTLSEEGLEHYNWKVDNSGLYHDPEEDPFKWSSTATFYIGQKRRLLIANGESGWSWSLDKVEQKYDNDTLRLSPLTENGDTYGCDISAIIPGTTSIYLTKGRRQYKIPVTSWAPSIRVNGDNDIELPLDGEKVCLELQYTGKDGEVLPYGCFDNELYDELLKMDVHSEDNIFNSCREITEDDDVDKWVTYCDGFRDHADHDTAPSIDDILFGIIVETPSEHIEDIAYDKIYPIDPYDGLVGSKLEDAEDYSLYNAQKSQNTYAIAIDAAEEYIVPRLTNKITGEVVSGDFGKAYEMDFAYRNGAVVIDFNRGEEYGHPNGQFTLEFGIRNRWSEETWFEESPRFSIDLKCHVAIGTVMEMDDEDICLSANFMHRHLDVCLADLDPVKGWDGMVRPRLYNMPVGLETVFYREVRSDYTVEQFKSDIPSYIDLCDNGSSGYPIVSSPFLWTGTDNSKLVYIHAYTANNGYL